MKNKILLAMTLIGSSSVAVAGGSAPIALPVSEPNMLPIVVVGLVALAIKKMRKK